MATKPSVQVSGIEVGSDIPSIPELDDLPDIPDELDDDVTGPIAPVSSGNSYNALSSEDLENMSFDGLAARDEANRAKIDPPAGDWLKDDRWVFGSRIAEGNCEVGDINPVGRTIFSVMGKPKARQVDGIDHQPTLFIRVSPDIRYKEDGKTFDSMHRMWLRVKDLHLALHDAKLSTPKQLKSMLEEDEYVVRTMRGDDGPIVVGVKMRQVGRQM